jgi:hypothetical protein
MLEVQHLNAGAARRLRLVLEARDAFDLLGRLVAAHGARLLAYCVMHTHLHLVIEGPLAEIVPLTNDALWGYTQSFNRRHGLSGPLLRGPVTAIAKHDAFELMRTIDYVHDNPTSCDPPIVERASTSSGVARERSRGFRWPCSPTSLAPARCSAASA